jgi:hypothetical protein
MFDLFLVWLRNYWFRELIAIAASVRSVPSAVLVFVNSELILLPFFSCFEHRVECD